MAYFIPDMPRWVEVQMARMEYESKLALIKEVSSHSTDFGAGVVKEFCFLDFLTDVNNNVPLFSIAESGCRQSQEATALQGFHQTKIKNILLMSQ
jgi:hypothetical protein